MRRIIPPLIFGFAGAALLIWLGIWQLERLAWKEAVLANIEARITVPPVALPEQPDPERDKYLPVIASGTARPGLRVLVGAKNLGPGYRMISILDLGGRQVLLDRGFLSIKAHTDFSGPREITVTGNLHWPDEVDGFTPDPDLEKGLWFARDVPAMAAALGTEPVLIIAREIEASPYSTTPLPVGITGIPNNHLIYAITWFSLAAIWLLMTGYYLWRNAQMKKGAQA
ncbi:Cytochrome oxidase biogenesis protein Surf1, facilitates heme A insertion [hydrothermal vent metagenome]|uniref:Cytochrome oxidase biogenesis protein Surf1, facilitates heme A insertion n=1 Tax=hydrothermal vent metagenome TaxID=652676 RepID=A0A3B0RIT6_9ZZZZ